MKRTSIICTALLSFTALSACGGDDGGSAEEAADETGDAEETDGNADGSDEATEGGEETGQEETGDTGDDDTGDTGEEATTFVLRIENVATPKDFLAGGVFNTPVGEADPGPLLPGGAYEFRFGAAPGMNLSFATMFVHSNDLFLAPADTGLPLFDASGTPLEGDVTDQLLLWDAGTEVDQEPGSGADQAPSQGGPDTGAADPDDTVRLANDGFSNLPAVDELVTATLTHEGGHTFVLRIENVTNDGTLVHSGGTTAVPFAPGVFAVHPEDVTALFAEGETDRGEGLEALAEDGDPAGLWTDLEARTGVVGPIAPGAFLVETDAAPLFEDGAPDVGFGLEALAEDGDPALLLEYLEPLHDEIGVFNTPVDATDPGPAFPGDAYEFTFSAVPGQYLGFATMFVQSNDLFYAPAANGMAVFDEDGAPLEGDITDQVLLWDGGTEVNQWPGAGPDQAPRQAGPNTGEAENGNVREVDDDFSYPTVADAIRVTLTPQR